MLKYPLMNVPLMNAFLNKKREIILFTEVKEWHKTNNVDFDDRKIKLSFRLYRKSVKRIK